MSVKVNWSKAPVQRVLNIHEKDEEEPVSERITHVSSAGFIGDAPKKIEEAPLVIPLIEHTWGDLEKEEVEPAALPQADEPSKPEDMETDAPSDIQSDTYGLIIVKKSQPVESSKPKKRDMPIMMRNRLPGWKDVQDNEEAKFRHDVNLRPESASLDAYDQMPVEKFGEALLRGMNWKPGDAIGNADKAVPVIEFVKRNHRLGLGATPKAPPDSNGVVETQVYKDETGRVRHVKPIDAKMTTIVLGLRIGSRVMIVKGDHEGVEAKVLQLDDKTAALILDNEERVRVGRTEIMELGEWRDKQRLLKKRTKNEDDESESKAKYAEKKVERKEDRSRSERKEDTRSERRDDDRSRSERKEDRYRDDNYRSERKYDRSERKEGSERKEDRYRDDKYRSERKDDRSERKDDRSERRDDRYRDDKYRDDKYRSERKEDRSERKETRQEVQWVQSDIRVRIRSKKIYQGKYYCKKATILDVNPGAKSLLKLEDGTMLENVEQSDLETVVPSIGGKVVVVRGEHRHARGLLLDKDSAKNKAQFQFLDSIEIIPLSLDDIAAYDPHL